MVNKVAVIAIVAILAVPILIGFGMNLEPTIKTEYIEDKDPVIVTNLLKNGTDYSYVHADSYQMNSNMSINYGDNESPVTPKFNSITNTKSPYNVQYLSLHNLSNNAYAPFTLMDIQIVYDDPSMNIGAYFTYNTEDQQTLVTSTYQHVVHIYYNRNMNNQLVLTIKPSQDATPYMVEIDNIDLVQGYYVFYNSSTADFLMSRYYSNGSTETYADLSKGYYFLSNDVEDTFSIKLPEKTKSAIMTVDLNSITTSNYNISIGTYNSMNNFKLIKNTSDGVVTWRVQKTGQDPIYLYYDPSRSDNTYQIKFDLNFVKTFTPVAGTEKKQYDLNIEFRYVGSWPIIIGEANYYQKYNLHTTINRDISDNEYLDRINLAYPLLYVGRTPTVRMDDALFAGFEYPVIRDNQYNPAGFKSNPSTTIKNITQYGDSIIFAGETYTVGSDGNIMIGIHKASLNGIVMDSVPVSGGYDNRINGYVISTTANPSTIDFKGAWVANISTDSQSTNSYQTTVWHAGEFAWDGMDQNFLIVGLITSLGVFIGLGIYARKSNSKGVIPLMIVCGCAAALFFIML